MSLQPTMGFLMLECVFKIENFTNAAADQLSVPEKKCYEGKLNLSSNELKHDDINNLVDEFKHYLNSGVITKYAYYNDLRKKIAKRYDVPSENLLLSAGSDIAISVLLRYCTEQTKNILLQTPNYYNYENYAILNQLNVYRESFLVPNEENFVQRFINKIKQFVGPALIVITNPNGYTGSVISLKEMQRIAKEAYAYGHLLLIDEAYISFNTFNHCSLLKNFSNVIVVRTFSKSLGMSGVRLAVVMACKGLIAYLRKTGIEGTVSRFAIHYLSFLLQHSESMRKIQDDIISSRDLFIQKVRKISSAWKVYNSNSNFVACDLGDSKLVNHLIETLSKKNVVIKSLIDCRELSTCVRITMAEEKFLEPVLAAMEELGKQACMDKRND